MSNKIKNIFKSEYTFENEYIPGQIPHREKEISLLSENLLKLITDSNAISRKIIVCGKLHTDILYLDESPNQLLQWYLEINTLFFLF